MIQKNAIVQIDDFPLLCLSPIFVIPKKTGDLRVILNLKKINVFMSGSTFPDGNTECNSTGIAPLRIGAVSLDLKDAYLHVPIHPQSRRLLGFRFQGKTYVYKVLPFGLKDSPWVFSRLVATVIAHLRLQGIRIFYYLDDWLIVAESQSVLQSHLRTTLQLVQNLGFIVNLKKSVFTPQKMPVYLGASLDIRRVNCASGRTQSFGSSVAHPGTRRVSDGSCPPVAESSRTFGQPCGSGSKLQASHCGLFSCTSFDSLPLC